MAVVDPPLIRSVDVGGVPPVGLGVPLLDEWVEFVRGGVGRTRCWATAFDLKVLFTVVALHRGREGTG